MIKPKEVSELIEMIEICRASARSTTDQYEGKSTYISGISRDSFLFVTSKAIAILKEINNGKEETT